MIAELCYRQKNTILLKPPFFSPVYLNSATATQLTGLQITNKYINLLFYSTLRHGCRNTTCCISHNASRPTSVSFSERYTSSVLFTLLIPEHLAVEQWLEHLPVSLGGVNRINIPSNCLFSSFSSFKKHYKDVFFSLKAWHPCVHHIILE